MSELDFDVAFVQALTEFFKERCIECEKRCYIGICNDCYYELVAAETNGG